MSGPPHPDETPPEPCESPAVDEPAQRRLRWERRIHRIRTARRAVRARMWPWTALALGLAWALGGVFLAWRQLMRSDLLETILGSYLALSALVAAVLANVLFLGGPILYLLLWILGRQVSAAARRAGVEGLETQT